jgi:hypothetical protein
LQSNINWHWFVSSESLVSINVYVCRHVLTSYQDLAFLFSTREEFDDYRSEYAIFSSSRTRWTRKIVFIKLSSSRFDSESVILSRCWTLSSWLAWLRVNQSNHHKVWKDNRLSFFW